MSPFFKKNVFTKPDGDYQEWLFPQNKQTLVFGLVFTFVTVTALSLLDYFYYADAYYSSLPVPIEKPFCTDNIFRLIIVPLINVIAIFLAKSKWNSSKKTIELLGGVVIFTSMLAFFYTSITNEYYIAGDDFAYDVLVLILFSQMLFGLSLRTSFIFNLILMLVIVVFMMMDQREVGKEDFIWTLALFMLVWVPLLIGALKLEQSKFSNFITISSLKEARNKMAKQEQMLREGEEVSRLASWNTNTVNGMMMVNYSEGVYPLFEFDKNRIKKSDLFGEIQKMVHPEDKKQVGENILLLRAGMVVPVSEHRIVLPDGRIKWQKVTVGKYSEIGDYYGTIQDITKEKELELELQKQARELQGQAVELKIKNADLQQFAYASSHDLQEPLRTISNFVSVLDKRLSDQLSEEHKLYMTLVLSSTERMKNLIHAILDYSRIGRDKTLEAIDCNDVVKGVIDDLTYAIQKSKGAVHVAQLPVVNGYKTELSTLLQNLISNALKFKREGVPPVVEIKAKATKNNFHFSVKDNGIGIDQKHADKIFQLFSRLHTQDKYEGTGIGLTHSKKIVELHGGKIWAESKINEGTTFHFIIPKNLKINTDGKETELYHVN